MAKKRKKSHFSIKCFLIAVIIIVFVLVLIQTPQSKACTEEAMTCPDGSAVGRVLPDCRFAPCPSCTCPTGYVLEGNVCNPECYYSTPQCYTPSIQCTYSNKTMVDLCMAAGGTVKTQLCCGSARDFPNTCNIGACGCSPENSKTVLVCDCGAGKCWNGSSCKQLITNDLKSCKSDSDCVGMQCCHPTSCMNKAYRGVCNELCTMVCQGPLDCGAGRCACVNNICTVIAT